MSAIESVNQPKTRRHPPASILVVLAVWSLTGLRTIWGLIGSGDWIAAGVSAVLGLWGVVSLWRMSRWPVVATIVSTAGMLAWNLYSDPSYLNQFPLLGVWAIIVPSAVFLLLVLPHWKRMNWSVFGRSDWSTGAA